VKRLGPIAALAAAALAVAGAAVAASFGQVDEARLLRAASEPQNWLLHGGDYQAQRYSGLDQINVDTVARLKPAWSFEFDTNRAQEATPIVVDGVAYVSTAWSKVYALDAATGKLIWAYDPKVAGEVGALACCDVGNRGVAVYKGRVYVGALDGRLIALNAATGRPVWSVQATDRGSVQTSTGAPRVARGLVFIGNAAGEFGGRGYISAFDAATGKRVWKFFTTPGDPAKKDGAASDDIMASVVQPTWFGPHTDWRGGGQVWNSIVYDPDLDQLYFATGNGFPWNRWWRSQGKGDNLFVASVVAVDARTGKYRWHYQESPGDSWDYDSIADIILADLTINGTPVKALMHTPKNGFFYVLDRRTGKLVSADPFVSGIDWATGADPVTGKMIVNPGAYFDNKTAVRVSPDGGGAHSWQPTAFSPKTGLMYLEAYSNTQGLYTPRPTYEWVKGLDRTGTVNYGAHAPGEGPPPLGDIAGNSPRPVQAHLVAWDPVARKPRWKIDGRGAGVLATAGNLVFQGRGRNVMGELVAFRADSGQQLWSYNTPNAIVTGPVTYSVGGEQYVLAVSGASGGVRTGTNDVRERQPGRLVAFKLGGTATLPPDPPPAPMREPPPMTWSAATVLQGDDLFGQFCSRCHAAQARSSNAVPDLRRSAALANPALWRAIVDKGAMKANGMIGWEKFLPPGGSDAIRAYVVAQAHKLRQDLASTASK
jgi:quinohemoprotein ethanol dehydrogenase